MQQASPMRSENHEETYDILQIKPEIDALWSTFRLPVPLPRKIGDHDPNATSTTATTTHGVSDEWLAQALDLLRLVHVMKNPPRESPFLSTSREQKHPRDSKERVMQSQVRLAYSMLDRVQRNFPLQNYNPQHQMEQMRQEGHQSDRERQQVVFHQNIYKFMESLTKDTLDICEKFQSRLDRHYALRRQQQVQQLRGRNVGKELGRQQCNAGNGYDSALFGERDLIYDIFLSSDQECPFLQPPEEKSGGESDRENEGDRAEYDDFEGYDDGDFEDDTPGASSSDPANHSHGQPHHSQQQKRHQQKYTQYQPRQEEIDPIEFQKQQQDLLEEELSTLASRLKSSTLAMNATLQTQTKELDDMEQIAQTNLDSVSTTTKKVEDRLKSKKGWKKRLATWSLIGVVVGMWVFCFMVIRTVPKRQIVFGGGRSGGGRGSGIGVSALWKNCMEYLHGLFGETEEQRYYREQKEQWLREELEREMARQKRAQEMREEKRREARRERQRQQREQELYQEELRRQEEKKEEERMQKQQQEYDKKHTEQECEILGDGTQVCSEAKKDEHAYKKVDIKAHEMAAERRRQRIEERMRNAPTVTAVDVTESLSQKMKHDKPVLGDDKLTGSGKSKDLYVDEEGNRCIPTTAKIHQIVHALDSLGETMVNMHAAIGRMPSQANKDSYIQALQSISSNVEKKIADLEQAKIDARNTWLNVNGNEAHAKRTDPSLVDIPFCEGGVQDGAQGSIFEDANNRDEQRNDRLHGEEAMEGGNHIAEEKQQREQFQQQRDKERAAIEGRGRVATKIEAERLRLEEEQQKHQLEQEAKLEEQKRIAIEEQRKREENDRSTFDERANVANETVESKRLRLEDEQKRTTEEEQLKKDVQRHLERELAEEDERVRVATEMQADRLRLEDEQKRTAEEEQRKKEIEQAEEEERVRVAMEIQSERLQLEEEQKRIADEEKRRRDLQERAEETTRVAKKMEAERLRLEEAARIAEEKRKRDAEEAARIAAEVEAERLRVEEERRQKEKAAAEARIIAQKKADLERERLERERLEADLLAAEEKSKQEIENIKKLALEVANQAFERSKDIVLEDPDFIAADVRFAAGRLNNDLLAHYISVMPEMVDARDGSGWSPIHEAARAGNICGVQLLISAGADVSARTGRGGRGGTALWWAIQRYGEDHDVVKLLRAHDAPEIGPDL